MTRRLVDPPHLGFPLRIGRNGAVTASRAEHVRQQIEQVLFTDPGERVFRPEFGAGLRTLVFEPNTRALWTVASKRILSALSDALQGEVDPRSLDVEVTGEGERLAVIVAYTVATIGRREQQTFRFNAGADTDG